MAPGDESQLPSVANLSRSLTINGTTVEPTFWYNGGDCDATDCDAEYGDALAFTSGGTDPTYNTGSPLLGADDDSVTFNAGDYYQAASTSFGDVTTEDLVFEAVLKKGSTDPYRTLGKWNDTDGWLFWEDDGVRFLIEESGTASASLDSGTLTAGAWYHAMVFVDRSGSSQIYVNGVASGSPVVVSAQSASISNSDKVTFGADGAGLFPTTSTFASAALWQSDDWLDTHLQADLAAERFQKLIGIWPRIGGSAASTISRASSAYLRNYDSGTGVTTLYQVGDNWPRVERFLDANGDVVVGLTMEPEATNRALHSHEIDGANWTTNGDVTVTADTYAAPTGAMEMDVLVEGATAATTRYIADSINGLTVGTVLTCSLYAKAINRDHIRTYLANGTNARLDWDLTDCSAAHILNEPDFYGGKDMGNGICHLHYAITTDATAGGNYIYLAEGPNDIVFDGQSQDSVALWGVTCTVNGEGEYVSSYIETNGTSATRAEDELVHDLPSATDLDSGGTLVVEYLQPNGEEGATGFHLYLQSSATDYNTDSVRIGNSGSDAVSVRAFRSSLQLSTASTTDPTDDTLHTLGFTWKTDNGTLFFDGVNEGTDSNGAIPAGLDFIDWLRDNPVTVKSLRLYTLFGEGLIQ